MDILQSVKDWFPKLLPEGKNAEQSTTNAAARATEQSEEDMAAAVAGGKRAREAESSSDGARASKKVKQSGSEVEEDNLTANYTKHPQANPISIPGRGHDTDWGGKPGASQASTRMVPAAARRGGVRPQNTLNNSAPQAAKRNMFAGYVEKNPRPAKATQPNGGAQSLLGRNGIAPGPSYNGDPIEDDGSSQQAARKRRKVNGDQMSSPVDLTDADNDFPVALGREKDERRLSGGSQVSNASKKSKAKNRVLPWAPTEQQAVDSLVQVKPGSMKQFFADTNFRHPLQGQDPAASRSIEEQSSVMIIDDDEPKVNNNAKDSASSQAKELNPKKRQPINLMEGWEEIDDKAQQRQQTIRKPQQQPVKPPPRARTEADMKGVNDLMSSAAMGNKSKPAKSNQPNSNARRSREQSHEANDGSFNHGLRPSSQRSNSASTSLQKKFIRDDQDAPAQKRQSAAQRMQTSDQTSPNLGAHPSIDDSIDELEGPPTVRKSTSRHVSPVKPSPAVSQANRRSASRQSSPSDIRRTNFTGSKVRQLQIANDSRAETSDVESLQDADDGCLRIAIQCIFCKAICLDQKGLELVWDDSLEAFVVFAQRHRQRAPNSKKPIAIGSAEVSTWISTKDHLGVQLKGPATDTSTGVIMIGFKDASGLADFHNTMTALNDRLQNKTMAQDAMKKTFEKQRDEQLKAHRLEKSRGLTAPVTLNKKLIERPPPAQQHQDAEEQIVYESDAPSPRQPPRNARARERMQTDGADTLARALDNEGYQNERRAHQSDETSRFFNNGGIVATRRSTRQPKPVIYEERAPSPVVEKWTKIHNPEPWAHPVLYPPEGAKRVTVEFNDLERLDEEEWLNDNLINYELKHIENRMDPEHRQLVHFFNTYFFTSVSTKGSRRAFNYDAVKKWTKNIDIFTKPYIVVPISENLHWFVIVICNLHNLPRKVAGPADEEEVDGLASSALADPGATGADNGTPAPNKDDPPSRQSPGTAADKPDSSPASAAQDTEQEEKTTEQATETKEAVGSPAGDTFTFGEDGKVTDTAIGEDAPQSSRPSTATGKKSKKKAPAPKRYDPDMPILIALDSFGHARSAEMKILKQWIAAEAEDKRGMEVNWQKLQGMNAKGLPAQLNFSDCGVYLAGYVHEFAKDPRAFITKVVLKELQQEMFEDFDPVKKRDDMRNRLLQLHKEQEEERIARKKAKAAARNGLTPQAPKVADAGKTEAVEAQSPTARSSPAPPPKSDNEKSLETSGTAAAQIQQEMTDATVAGEDDLPVSPPRALGAKADRDEPSDPHPSDREPAGDEGNEEMLDDPGEEELEYVYEEPGRGGFAFPPEPPANAPSTNIFKQDLPVAAAVAEESQTNNLLDGLLQYAKEPVSEPQGEVKEVINLEEDDDEEAAPRELEPVIPDSQENGKHPVAGERNDPLEF